MWLWRSHWFDGRKNAHHCCIGTNLARKTMTMLQFSPNFHLRRLLSLYIPTNSVGLLRSYDSGPHSMNLLWSMTPNTTARRVLQLFHPLQQQSVRRSAHVQLYQRKLSFGSKTHPRAHNEIMRDAACERYPFEVLGVTSETIERQRSAFLTKFGHVVNAD